MPGTCEAGGRIKPGAQALGRQNKNLRREPVKRATALPPAIAGSVVIFLEYLGLTPQALCLRLLRRLRPDAVAAWDFL